MTATKDPHAQTEEPDRQLATVESFGAKISRKLAEFSDSLSHKSLKVRISTEAKAVSEGTSVTAIPKIIDKNLKEIDIQPMKDGYSYVRILYNNVSSQYLYEGIEPPLSIDDKRILDLLKISIINGFELLGHAATNDEREAQIRQDVDKLLRSLGIKIKPVIKERIMYYVLRDFIGYGMLEVAMIDTQVEDVSCDGVGIPIYIFHRKYGSIPSNLMFTSHAEVDSFVLWLAQRCGKQISVAEPILDATIPDGSRLQATLGMHVTKKGSSFTIRRFREEPFTPLDLLRFKLMSEEMMAYLWLSIENGQSMLVCGGTASGKTTTLNGVLLFIPPNAKIVSIEDTRELNLPHQNWIPGLTRSGFGGKNPITGKAAGEVDMFDLLMASMRMRPQYLMVGEVRGSEAYVVFQAMATGKTAYSTFHAEDVQAMVNRMENPPISLPRSLVAALDICTLQAQVKVGLKMTRRIKGLVEIVGIDPETGELITNAAYTWNPADDTFSYSGHSYTYTKIQANHNWSARRLDREVKDRILALRYMIDKGFKTNVEVGRMISAYLREPDTVKEMVRAYFDEKDKAMMGDGDGDERRPF